LEKLITLGSLVKATEDTMLERDSSNAMLDVPQPSLSPVPTPQQAPQAPEIPAESQLSQPMGM